MRAWAEGLRGRSSAISPFWQQQKKLDDVTDSPFFLVKPVLQMTTPSSRRVANYHIALACSDNCGGGAAVPFYIPISACNFNGENDLWDRLYKQQKVGLQFWGKCWWCGWICNLKFDTKSKEGSNKSINNLADWHIYWSKNIFNPFGTKLDAWKFADEAWEVWQLSNSFINTGLTWGRCVR